MFTCGDDLCRSETRQSGVELRSEGIQEYLPCDVVDTHRLDVVDGEEEEAFVGRLLSKEQNDRVIFYMAH